MSQFVGNHALKFIPVQAAHHGAHRHLQRRRGGGAPGEALEQPRDVAVALAQRRDRDLEAAQPVEQVGQELVAPHEVQRLTMVCGLAVIDAIESETGLQVGLKWPNDVVVGPAKVAGILTEIGAQGSKVDFVVVGLGLNVNLNPAGLPDGLLVPATSLSHELKHPVARLPLLVALLQAMETRYTALKAGRSPHLEWAGRLVTLGRPVTVSTIGASLEGVAEGVNADGALLVRLDSGRLETVMAGDVTLRTRGRSGHT